jgi:lipopolysaccharide export LptBFGC system permease protein LptF
MPRRAPLTLNRIVQLLARHSTPQHRDLAQGMVSELDAISHPAERRRFALGAIAAIVLMTLSGRIARIILAPGQLVGVSHRGDAANQGDPPMSGITTRQLLQRHATSFAVSLATLTISLLANFALKQIPDFRARGLATGEIVEVLLLAAPFTFALTIPMAVFFSVVWEFARLGREGVLASARQERQGIRRLLVPVMGAAAVVAMLALVVNTQVVPRANTRLMVALTDAAPAGDRTRTIGALREAVRSAQSEGGTAAAARVAAIEVEIQKKYALAFACVVLAFAGAVIPLRFPRGGTGLVIATSLVVFAGYYVALVAGESLADRQVISPWIAMWMANASLVAVVLVICYRAGGPDSGRRAESLAIGG